MDTSRTRKPRTTRNVTRKLTRQELVAFCKKKRLYESKALQIVHLLIQGKFEEKELLKHLGSITQSHYEDIVEERAVTKLCGYPLCDNELTNVPKKRFHISVSENKVYDITERKNFCSKGCYTSSCYLKYQLLTSPVWLRETEVIPEFSLLPIENSKKQIGGEEVKICQRISSLNLETE